MQKMELIKQQSAKVENEQGQVVVQEKSSPNIVQAQEKLLQVGNEIPKDGT
jgi:hypothetical protein